MGYKPIRPTATTVGGGRTEGGKLIGSDGNTDSGLRRPESSCKIARRLWSEAWVDPGERRRGNTRRVRIGSHGDGERIGAKSGGGNGDSDQLESLQALMAATAVGGQ